MDTTATNNLKSTVKASFPVRRMDFQFGEVPQYWVANKAGLTHWMTALSALFPDGEKFFVDSVRAVRNHPNLKAIEMQKEISAFIGQEAMHSKEHMAFNHSAKIYGYDIVPFEKLTGKVIKGVSRFFAKGLKPFGFSKEMVELATTCALEHFTATAASAMLKNKEFQDLILEETMFKLLMWHSVEENEHKAVVYDIMAAVYGKGMKFYTMRAIAMTVAMPTIFLLQSYFVYELMKQDKKLISKDMLEMLNFYYGPKGFITKQIPELLTFYLPNFHPNDFDTHALLADWQKKLGYVAH